MRERTDNWEPPRSHQEPWYVAPRLEGELLVRTIGLCDAVAGCGGGESQDENEPAGNYRSRSRVPPSPRGRSSPSAPSSRSRQATPTTSEFPTSRSPSRASTSASRSGLADQRRPVFVVNGQFKDFGNFPEAKTPPQGRGDRLRGHVVARDARAGRGQSFKWDVTAVVAGPMSCLRRRRRPRRQGEGGRLGGPRARRALRRHDLRRRAGHARRRRRQHHRARHPVALSAVALSGRPAARIRGTRAPGSSGTWEMTGRSWTARTSRTSSRGCSG